MLVLKWRRLSMRNPQDFKIRCSAIGKIMSNAKTKGELSATCKTYLQEWYANDDEPIHSKYIDKGEMVEDDLIDFMAIQLGFGLAEKCRQGRSDEYFTGTCDVELDDTIVDVKAPFNKKTFLQNITEGINTDYEWQLIGYCHLYNKPKGILFYGLMDTPGDVNYGNEVTYSDMPMNERWIAYNIPANPEKVNLIIERVKECRNYLEKYDAIIKEKLGKLI